jgi:hypothetical protein
MAFMSASLDRWMIRKSASPGNLPDEARIEHTRYVLRLLTAPSARTEWPALSASFTVSRPIPLLAPSVRIVLIGQAIASHQITQSRVRDAADHRVIQPPHVR